MIFVLNLSSLISWIIASISSAARVDKPNGPITAPGQWNFVMWLELNICSVRAHQCTITPNIPSYEISLGNVKGFLRTPVCPVASWVAPGMLSSVSHNWIFHKDRESSETLINYVKWETAAWNIDTTPCKTPTTSLNAFIEFLVKRHEA